MRFDHRYTNRLPATWLQAINQLCFVSDEERNHKWKTSGWFSVAIRRANSPNAEEKP